MVMQNMCFISTNKQPLCNRHANKQLVNIVRIGPYTKVLPKSLYE